MAEAVAIVGLVASIVQLVDFGGKLGERIDEFASATHEVPASFRAIRLQLPLAINALQRVVEQVQHGSVSATDAQALTPLVDSSLALTKTLTAILDKAVPSGVFSTFRKALQAAKSFKYDKKVQRSVEQLQSNIQILIFHQNTHHTDVATAICQKLEQLKISPSAADPHLGGQNGVITGDPNRIGKILLWLRAADLEGIRREKKKSPGTCEWIKTKEQFTQWHECIAPRCLWIRGIPGCGKSVLASSIINWLAEKDDVLYFFCRSTDPDKRSTGAVLRTLASQALQYNIITRSLNLLEAIFERIWVICETFQDVEMASVDTLWRILEMILAQFQSVTIVIDGLDECDAHHQERIFLTDKLKGFAHSKLDSRVLILSRDLQDLERLVGSSMAVISIQEMDVKGDILVMVEQGVTRSAKLSLIKEKVVLPVTDGSRGMFLWASLMLANLETSINLRSVHAKLQKMPIGLSSMYMNIIHDIASNLTEEERHHQQRIFSWIMTVVRPLYLYELRVALSITSDALDVAEEDLVLDIRADVNKVCGPLVWIRQDGTVHPVHLSAKEALCEGSGGESQWIWTNGATDRYHIDSKSVHLDVGRTCVTYLSFPVLAKPSLQVSLVGDAAFASELAEQMPFLTYASSSWHLHFAESIPTGEEPFELLQRFVQSDNCFTWLECYSFFAALAPGEFGHHFQVQAKLREWASRYPTESAGAKDAIDNYVVMATEKIVDISKREFGFTDERIFAVMSRLGALLAFLNRHEEAREIRLTVFNGYKDIFGMGDLRTRKACTDLGYVSYMLDELGPAEELFYQSLAGRNVLTWGKEMFDFETMKELGTVYLLQKRYEEARELLEYALDGMILLLTERHRLVVLCRQYLAAAYRNMGDNEKALQVAVKGHETSVDLQGEDHPDTLRGIPFIAVLHMRAGDLETAEEMFQRLLLQQTRVLGEWHADTYWTVACLGTAFAKQGRTAEAEVAFRKALAGTRGIFGKQHSSTTWMATELHGLLRDIGRGQDAEQVASDYTLEVAG